MPASGRHSHKGIKTKIHSSISDSSFSLVFALRGEGNKNASNEI